MRLNSVNCQFCEVDDYNNVKSKCNPSISTLVACQKSWQVMSNAIIQDGYQQRTVFLLYLYCSLPITRSQYTKNNSYSNRTNLFLLCLTAWNILENYSDGNNPNDPCEERAKEKHNCLAASTWCEFHVIRRKRSMPCDLSKAFHAIRKQFFNLEHVKLS